MIFFIISFLFAFIQIETYRYILWRNKQIEEMDFSFKMPSNKKTFLEELWENYFKK